MYLNRFQEDTHLSFCYDLVSPYLSIKNLSGSLFVVSLLLGWHCHLCIPMIKGFQACWQSSNFWLLVVYMGMGIFYHDFRLIQYLLFTIFSLKHHLSFFFFLFLQSLGFYWKQEYDACRWIKASRFKLGSFIPCFFSLLFVNLMVISWYDHFCLNQFLHPDAWSSYFMLTFDRFFILIMFILVGFEWCSTSWTTHISFGTISDSDRLLHNSYVPQN